MCPSLRPLQKLIYTWQFLQPHQGLLQVRGVLQGPVSQGPPCLARCSARGCGESAQGGSHRQRRDRTAWKQRGWPQLWQLRVWGCRGEHALLCSGFIYSWDVVEFSGICTQSGFFQMQKVRDEDYDSCGRLIKYSYILMMWYFDKVSTLYQRCDILLIRKISCEKEVVWPGRWNNGRLPLWPGNIFISFWTNIM